MKKIGKIYDKSALKRVRFCLYETIYIQVAIIGSRFVSLMKVGF